MVAVLKIAGEFKEIRAAVELGQKSWENARSVRVVGGTRGKNIARQQKK